MLKYQIKIHAYPRVANSNISRVQLGRVRQARCGSVGNGVGCWKGRAHARAEKQVPPSSANCCRVAVWGQCSHLTLVFRRNWVSGFSTKSLDS